jgi:hypothetical protein
MHEAEIPARDIQKSVDTTPLANAEPTSPICLIANADSVSKVLMNPKKAPKIIPVDRKLYVDILKHGCDSTFRTKVRRIDVVTDGASLTKDWCKSVTVYK